MSNFYFFKKRTMTATQLILVWISVLYVTHSFSTGLPRTSGMVEGGWARVFPRLLLGDIVVSVYALILVLYGWVL